MLENNTYYVSTTNFKTQVINTINQFKETYIKQTLVTGTLTGEENNNNAAHQLPKELAAYINKLELCYKEAKSGSSLWKMLKNEINKMPGFWSFFNPLRRLTLALEDLLSKNPEKLLMEDDLDRANQTLEGYQRTNIELQDQIKGLELNVNMLKKIQRKMGDQAKLLRECETEKVRADFFEKLTLELKAENQILETVNGKLSETIGNLKQQIIELTESNKDLEEANKNLQDMYDLLQQIMDEEKAKNKTTFADINAKFDLLAEDVAALKADKRKLNNTVQKQAKDIEDLKSENGGLSNTIQEQIKKIENLESPRKLGRSPIKSPANFFNKKPAFTNTTSTYGCEIHDSQFFRQHY